MRQTIIASIISAVIGGLIAAAAIFYLLPAKSQSVVKEIIKQRTIRGQPSGAQLTAEQIYDQFSPAVVNVSSLSSGIDFFGFRSLPEEATGSGFFISKDGLIVTNEHVVEGAERVRVTLADKTELPAKVVGTDRSTDLALLKIDISGAQKITTLEIGDSSDIKVGDTVYAIGNPLGLERSMSQGIISALDRTIEAPNGFQIRGVIQTDAAINRGNSGGPLINTDGNVIGVTAQIATESGSPGNIGIAFAIPGNTVKEIVEQLKKGGKVSHPWLGISGRDVTKPLAEQFELPVNSGALIADIFPDSPADKAGLKGGRDNPAAGDIIVEFGGAPIKSMEDLVKVLDKYKVGQEVRMIVYRDRQKTEVTIKLEERPERNFGRP